MQNIGRKGFSQFLCHKELNACPSDDTLLIFTEHKKNVKDDIKLRFQDFSALDILPWIFDTFQTSDISIDPSIGIELTNLANDIELKPSYKKHANQQFWLQSIIKRKISSTVDFFACPNSYSVKEVSE